MTTRKESILKEFEALEAVLEEAPQAANFQKTVNSIKAKLQAEKDQYLSQFEESDTRVKVPSMGMIEMVSEKSESPQYYFGSPIKARDHIKIRVYQASVNPKTEEVMPEELVSEVVMTEKQLGDILSQPGRGTGFPVTQVVREGQAIEPYDPAGDPGKADMNRLQDAIGEDPYLAKTFQGIREKLEEAKEQGRLKKKDGAQMAHNLRSATRNLPSNSKFRVDQITEAYSERVAECALALHLDIRSEQARLSYKKDED